MLEEIKKSERYRQLMVIYLTFDNDDIHKFIYKYNELKLIDEDVDISKTNILEIYSEDRRLVNFFLKSASPGQNNIRLQTTDDFYQKNMHKIEK